MSAQLGFGIRLYGMKFEDFHLPVNLASGITRSDEGKALTWDGSGPNKMKLAGDGDAIVARLEVVENRLQEGVLVGTAAFKFGDLIPIKSGLSGGDVVAVTKAAVGAGAGEIKGETWAAGKPRVVELVTVGGVAYAAVANF